MLIDPVFDESVVRKQFRDDVQDEIKVVKDDSQFVVYILDNGEWFPTQGFEKIQTGVFWTDLNPDIYLEQKYGRNLLDSFEYGVGDSPEQILNHPSLQDYIVSDKAFVICLTPITRASQPKHGGWRWHKWGGYIGEKNPQYEYLYDEPDIDEVVIYSLYNIPKEY